jgi:HD-GYP domain-containing protein (c-di-GMP phosphodiesterase class II)
MSRYKLDDLDQLLRGTRDLDVLLGRLLGEAIKATGAEGGTVFLQSRGGLRVAHLENDVLMKRMKPADIASLVSTHIRLDRKGSIAGHVAATGQMLRFDDVYCLGDDSEVVFDRGVDEALQYRTRAMLTAPLIAANGDVAGVLQLLNPACGDDPDRAVFSREDESFLKDLGRIATTAIERARMERVMLLRMVKMAELRDPTETGTHVNRVAAVSVLIFEKWAVQTGADSTWRDAMVDDLRIAAMLHDVGKVAIDDSVLKKPGRLDEQERAAMELHTLKGAILFDDAQSPADQLARDVALHHHQRWDGGGYPAVLIGGENRPLRESEIPIAARLVAIADVHDALSSKRAYKEAWPREKIESIIVDGRGAHFDPEIVDIFLEHWDEIERVRALVPDGDGV